MAYEISGLRASINKITAAIRGQSKSVETTQREYEDVEAAPPSRGDVKAYFSSIIAVTLRNTPIPSRSTCRRSAPSIYNGCRMISST